MTNPQIMEEQSALEEDNPSTMSISTQDDVESRLTSSGLDVRLLKKHVDDLRAADEAKAKEIDRLSKCYVTLMSEFHYLKKEMHHLKESMNNKFDHQGEKAKGSSPEFEEECELPQLKEELQNQQEQNVTRPKIPILQAIRNQSTEEPTVTRQSTEQLDIMNQTCGKTSPFQDVKDEGCFPNSRTSAENGENTSCEQFAVDHGYDQCSPIMLTSKDRSVRITRYSRILKHSRHMHMDSGMYRVPSSGKYIFGMRIGQIGEGKLDWLLVVGVGLAETERKRKDNLSGEFIIKARTVQDMQRMDRSKEIECKGGDVFWIEVRRVKGTAEPCICEFYGRKIE